VSDKLDRLQTLLARVDHLSSASAVLTWDQETYMPAGGAEPRAQHLATLSQLSHEFFTDEEIGTLLDQLQAELSDADPDTYEASLVRVTKREYDKATKIPSELIAELSRTSSHAKEAWKEARATDDFEKFQPHLEKLVDLNKRMADALGYADRMYDALLDNFEPEMRTADVERIFGDLREKLVPIVERISEREAPDDGVVRRHFPTERQWAFGLSVVEDYGFDTDCGRQDYSTHPFTISFAPSDVRLTTRLQEDYLPSGLFGTLHECGHGLYEQGIPPEWADTPLGSNASLGLHESQSRLWENLVGRSYAFWRHYYPQLQETFPDQLSDVDLDHFYRAINRAEPSFIRVEADEVTYNLHIMLRFELENAMLDDEIAIKDLPDAWNAKMEDYLGITPPNHAEGVLQDIHWSMGALGYFPTYALGNLMSCQLYRAANDAIPDLEAQIADGQFGDLLGWMRTNVHQHGKKYAPQDLLKRATGQTLGADDFVGYIRDKYSGIYGALD